MATKATKPKDGATQPAPKGKTATPPAANQEEKPKPKTRRRSVPKTKQDKTAELQRTIAAMSDAMKNLMADPDLAALVFDLPGNRKTLIDWKKLREPFPVEELKLRAGWTNAKGKKGTQNYQPPTRCTLLTYIDARTVEDRLDDVVGPERWRDSYRWIDNGKGIECTLEIWNGHVWVSKTDAADWTRIEGTKGGYSDSLKRAAAKHGIGRELYDLPEIFVSCTEEYGRVKFDHKAAFKQLFSGYTPKEREINYGEYKVEWPEEEDFDDVVKRVQAEQAARQPAPKPETQKPAAQQPAPKPETKTADTPPAPAARQPGQENGKKLLPEEFRSAETESGLPTNPTEIALFVNKAYGHRVARMTEVYKFEDPHHPVTNEENEPELVPDPFLVFKFMEYWPSDWDDNAAILQYLHTVYIGLLYKSENPDKYAPLTAEAVGQFLGYKEKTKTE